MRVTALNLKEASHLHAEAFAAGELKHGVIALIEEGMPVVIFGAGGAPLLANVAAEVKSRGAYVIGIDHRPSEFFDEFLPTLGHDDVALGSVLEVVPGQLLAYQLAVMRDINPDRPRNLAKCVTVR